MNNVMNDVCRTDGHSYLNRKDRQEWESRGRVGQVPLLGHCRRCGEGRPLSRRD